MYKKARKSINSPICPHETPYATLSKEAIVDTVLRLINVAYVVQKLKVQFRCTVSVTWQTPGVKVTQISEVCMAFSVHA